MKPIKLFIENFMCYDRSEIDFTSFNSAVIIGKVDGNELYSNGVGKTTIFKAIEYVLFNYSSANLEKIIKEDAASCKIIFDFSIDDKIYRICRSRTKKSSISDLSFYERNAVESDIAHDFNTDLSLWENKTSRRTQDTEKDINNLIKLNYKSFISTIHFAQNDMSGLTTATPEKRKQILKEALQLSVYSKLEKIAKEKYNNIQKTFDKNKTIIETLGDCESDIISLNSQSEEIDINLKKHNALLIEEKSKLQILEDELSLTNIKINQIKSDQASTLKTINSISNIILGINDNINSLTIKKNKITTQSKEIVSNLKSLKDKKINIDTSKFENLEDLKINLEECKKNIISNTITIKNNIQKIKDLNSQLDFFKLNGGTGSCSHCKQELNKDHLDRCESEISNEIRDLENKIEDLDKLNLSLNKNKEDFTNSISNIEKNIKSFNDIDQNIKIYEEKYIENKKMYEEYSSNISSYKKSLKDNEDILSENKNILENKNNEELISLEELVKKLTTDKKILQNNIDNISETFAKLSNQKSIYEHTLSQKKADLIKIKDLTEENEKFINKIAIYPSVIQSFSSSGIPALIIQNVLDDLQIETNNLLSQLRPGLQLIFSIEKTKTDGTQDETLDIQYLLNGKSREYEQLSGAMKIVVTFSLKLGLSFLLQKIMGADIKMLLLDEIDQPLDKAGIDALYDIIKFFQKDFKILVITHNDRMKQKFNNGILVEQDINGTSRAKVVESW